jgi:hypothetical protein
MLKGLGKADRLDDLPGCHVGQVVVEHQHVDVGDDHGLREHLAVGGRVDLVALDLEELLHQDQELDVVVHQDHRALARGGALRGRAGLCLDRRGLGLAVPRGGLPGPLRASGGPLHTCGEAPLPLDVGVEDLGEEGLVLGEVEAEEAPAIGDDLVAELVLREVASDALGQIPCEGDEEDVALGGLDRVHTRVLRTVLEDTGRVQVVADVQVGHRGPYLSRNPWARLQEAALPPALLSPFRGAWATL